MVFDCPTRTQRRKGNLGLLGGHPGGPQGWRLSLSAHKLSKPSAIPSALNWDRCGTVELLWWQWLRACVRVALNPSSVSRPRREIRSRRSDSFLWFCTPKKDGTPKTGLLQRQPDANFETKHCPGENSNELLVESCHALAALECVMFVLQLLIRAGLAVPVVVFNMFQPKWYWISWYFQLLLTISITPRLPDIDLLMDLLSLMDESFDHCWVVAGSKLLVIQPLVLWAQSVWSLCYPYYVCCKRL